jgi:anti-sigma-K factor RskA
MSCKENEERLSAYMLGALDASERAEMEAHIDRCGECLRALREDGDLIVHMAYAAPQLEAPVSVEQRLMDRISEASPEPSLTDALLRWLSGLGNAGHRVVAGPAGVVAGAMVIVLFLVGAWFNVRLNEIAEEKEILESQLETMVDGEAERAKLVNDLRELTFWATAPDASVKHLSASDGTTDEVRGFIVARTSETAVMVAAADMPALPSDKVFRVWAISHDGEYRDAGTLKVDSKGWGITHIELGEPVSNFEGVMITVEPAADTSGPAGSPVLKGNLGDQ